MVYLVFVVTEPDTYDSHPTWSFDSVQHSLADAMARAESIECESDDQHAAVEDWITSDDDPTLPATLSLEDIAAVLPMMLLRPHPHAC